MENKLYYGDNLKILRDYIKDNSIDLIYLDPPFNSQANYNILFREASTATGGRGEQKSKAQIEAFTDFWTWDEESTKAFEYLTTQNENVPIKVSELISALHAFLGENQMSAYLVMMAIRLLELHRVLKDTGSLYLHCDPTASHYLKLVLDSIFGEQNFQNEIVWCYTGGGASTRRFAQKHDTIFFYSKSKNYKFNAQYLPYKEHSPYHSGGEPYREEGKVMEDYWLLNRLGSTSEENLGYPTQKPLPLLERIVKASSDEGDLVLDPFCGCGTTIDASEKLGRNWIGIDITHLAINVIKKRVRDKYPKAEFKIIGEPQDYEGARDLASRDKKEFEVWAIALVGAKPVETDKGRDGILLLRNPNEKGKITKVIVQVKGGEHLAPTLIRDLRGTIEREEKLEGRKTYGLFICLEEPTDGMRKEASVAGFNTIKIIDESIPRIEILTIKDLVEKGKMPKIVELLGGANISYPKAEITKEEKARAKKGSNKRLS